jgi:hypothetical protein
MDARRRRPRVEDEQRVMMDLIVADVGVHFAFLFKNGHEAALAPRDV